MSLVLCSVTLGRWHIHKWKVCTMSRPFTRRLTQMYSSIESEFSWPFFWTICHLNVSLVFCSITFGWWHMHKWKDYMILGPFTCCLIQMYNSMKSELSWPSFWTICHLNVSLVLCSITFGWWHKHKWKDYKILGPFTCHLTQMYNSIKSELSGPFFGQFAT